MVARVQLQHMCQDRDEPVRVFAACLREFAISKWNMPFSLVSNFDWLQRHYGPWRSHARFGKRWDPPGYPQRLMTRHDPRGTSKRKKVENARPAVSWSQVNPTDTHALGFFTPLTRPILVVYYKAMADTGCQSCLSGTILLSKLGLNRNHLILVNMKMTGVNSRSVYIIGALILWILGSAPLNIEHQTHKFSTLPLQPINSSCRLSHNWRTSWEHVRPNGYKTDQNDQYNQRPDSEHMRLPAQTPTTTSCSHITSIPRQWGELSPHGGAATVHLTPVSINTSPGYPVN